VWGLIALILLVFAATNLYGYVKCSKEQQSSIMKFGAKTVLKAAEKGVNVVNMQGQK
jgi:cytochrome oxidase Cu insertion factor (SCO1/SenC/PrrC family)